MKRIIKYSIILIIVILISGGIWFYFRPKSVSVTNFEECLKAGYPVTESFPRQCRAPHGQVFTENVGNALEKIDLIRLTTPKPNQKIESPLTIEGEARGYWFFEASFPVKIFDANSMLLGSAIAQAEGDWMTENFVPFEALLEFVPSTTEKGTLILEKDNPSGLPENADELIIPIAFEKVVVSEETMTVEAFFNNDRLDPEFSCNKVFPVVRQIPKTLAVGRAALEELLKGPTEEEKEEGFFTSINSGVKIQSLTIENGVARADFDDQLEFQVGGSCRVSAIRAQITQTLKQFSTVRSVIISINGRTEDILQP